MLLHYRQRNGMQWLQTVFEANGNRSQPVFQAASYYIRN